MTYFKHLSAHPMVQLFEGEKNNSYEAILSVTIILYAKNQITEPWAVNSCRVRIHSSGYNGSLNNLFIP